MSAIILRKSFSTEFGENTAHFLNFKTTRSLIKFLSPSRKLRPDARPYWRFESFFLIYRRRQPREKKREVAVPPGPARKNGKRKKKTERVGPRVVGLMSLIMEKYIKWRPLYFLRSISPSDATRLVYSHPSRAILGDILIFTSIPPRFSSAFLLFFY